MVLLGKTKVNTQQCKLISSSSVASSSSSLKCIKPNQKAIGKFFKKIPKVKEIMKECVICYDSYKPTEGYECNQHHFICSNNDTSCFHTQIKLQISDDTRIQLSNNDCHIVCCICNDIIPDKTICNLSIPLFEQFLKARESIAIKKTIAEYEIKLNIMKNELEDEISKGNDSSIMVLRHRNHIINNIITLKCPRCDAAFFMPSNFQSCFALSCDFCRCGFCAW
jgi:hypothetical protein